VALGVFRYLDAGGDVDGWRLSRPGGRAGILEGEKKGIIK
jgi:hypothetical protein